MHETIVKCTTTTIRIDCMQRSIQVSLSLSILFYPILSYPFFFGVYLQTTLYSRYGMACSSCIGCVLRLKNNR